MWVLLWGALALADTDDTGTDTSSDTGAADTGAEDTGASDTGAQDTGDSDTGDSDTGDPDTGDATDPIFAAPSASELSGEVGGFRCATGVTPGAFGALAVFVLLWRRR